MKYTIIVAREYEMAVAHSVQRVEAASVAEAEKLAIDGADRVMTHYNPQLGEPQDDWDIVAAFDGWLKNVSPSAIQPDCAEGVAAE